MRLNLASGNARHVGVYVGGILGGNFWCTGVISLPLFLVMSESHSYFDNRLMIELTPKANYLAGGFF